jgi:hypothetical protein
MVGKTFKNTVRLNNTSKRQIIPNTVNYNNVYDLIIVKLFNGAISTACAM